MISGLLQTMFIAIGMSLNGMPICHKAENIQKQEITENKIQILPHKATTNETIVQDYTLDFNSGNETTNTYISRYNNYPNRIVAKRNITGNNSYLNVMGNMYRQLTKNTTGTITLTGDAQCYVPGLSNYYYGDNEDLWSDNAEFIPRMMYVLEITPYNFNVNTQIDIRISININNDNVSTNDIYLKYRTYEAIEDWSSLINMQITDNLPLNIEKQIQNPNNNYYYNEVDYLDIYEDATPTGSAKVIDRVFTFNLVANTTNYYIIDAELFMSNYTLYNNQKIYIDPTDFGTEYAETTSTTNIIRPYGTRQFRITGTNIIPPSTYEIVDLPGLMFDVLGMPFSFLSQAFNVTLFPGTPYQINISNLFLAIISILIFIFLMKLIVGAVSHIGT